MRSPRRASCGYRVFRRTRPPGIPADGFCNHMRQERTGAGTDALLGHRDVGEAGRFQANDRSADPFIPDQQIRAAAEDMHGDLLRVATFQHAGKFVRITRNEEELRGSA